MTLLALCTVITASCSGGEPSVTVSDLRILRSDNPSLTDAQKSDRWRLLEDLRNVTLAFGPKNSYTYIWVAGSFDLEDPSRYAGIYVQDALVTKTIYINGVMIGKSNPDDLSWNMQYPIPSAVVRKGKNDVHISMGIYGIRDVSIGKIKSDMQIQTKEEYTATFFWNNLFYRQAILGVIVILTTFMIVHILYFIVDRTSKNRLWYSLGLLMCIIISASLLIPAGTWKIDYMITFFFCIFLAAICYMGIAVQGLYGIFFPNHNRVLVIGTALCMVLACIFYNDFIIQSLAVMAVFVSCFGLMGYMVFQMHRIKKNWFNLYLILSVIVVWFILNMWAILSSHLKLYFPEFINFYIMPFYMMTGILYEARESKKQKIRIDRLYDQLRDSKESKPAKLTITESAEEKLQRVIKFINENYTSDLSREGLAAAVDLNPNYFSSLFNAYTGKKINEYINGLRIQEAARQIAQTENKIIDIAFAMGFESLATFIRSFKNEMGTTPSEYREQIRAV